MSGLMLSLSNHWLVNVPQKGTYIEIMIDQMAIDQWLIKVVLFTLLIGQIMSTLIKWHVWGDLNCNKPHLHYLSGTQTQLSTHVQNLPTTRASMSIWKIVKMSTHTLIILHLFSIYVVANLSKILNNFLRLICKRPLNESSFWWMCLLPSSSGKKSADLD